MMHAKPFNSLLPQRSYFHQLFDLLMRRTLTYNYKLIQGSSADKMEYFIYLREQVSLLDIMQY